MVFCVRKKAFVKQGLFVVLVSEGDCSLPYGARLAERLYIQGYKEGYSAMRPALVINLFY